MRRLLPLVAVCLSPFFACACACACGCGESSFDNNLQYVDEAFRGELLAIERYDAEPILSGHTYTTELRQALKYTFKVKQKWIGSSDEIVVVYNEGTSCDAYFDFQQREHLVYASRETGLRWGEDSLRYTGSRGELVTNMCFRHRALGFGYERSDTLFLTEVALLDARFPEQVALRRPLAWRIAVALLPLLAAGLVVSIVLTRKA